jgi:hypothetical protein
MRSRRRRAAPGALTGILVVLLLAGCQSGPQSATPEGGTAAEAVTEESRGVADASLGKQSEILAHGDLALNGREQLLVVNRSRAGGPKSKDAAGPAPIFITRAAVLEKNDGRWSEILRCDEHLKNPSGYLGGIPRTRFTGWQLIYSQDPAAGLEMKFAPVETPVAASANSGEGAAQGRATFDVRWNKNTKRYQSFDQSHERYLSELPSLETPESSLR